MVPVYSGRSFFLSFFFLFLPCRRPAARLANASSAARREKMSRKDSCQPCFALWVYRVVSAVRFPRTISFYCLFACWKRASGSGFRQIAPFFFFFLLFDILSGWGDREWIIVAMSGINDLQVMHDQRAVAHQQEWGRQRFRLLSCFGRLFLVTRR